MMVPKQNGRGRMVGDFRAVNKQVKKVPSVMPDQEASMAKLTAARFFGSMDMLQGLWTVGHLSSVVESTDLMDACIRIA